MITGDDFVGEPVDKFQMRTGEEGSSRLKLPDRLLLPLNTGHPESGVCAPEIERISKISNIELKYLIMSVT
jgi:hypothetical protein